MRRLAMAEIFTLLIKQHSDLAAPSAPRPQQQTVPQGSAGTTATNAFRELAAAKAEVLGFLAGGGDWKSKLRGKRAGLRGLRKA